MEELTVKEAEWECNCVLQELKAQAKPLDSHLMDTHTHALCVRVRVCVCD